MPFVSQFGFGCTDGLRQPLVELVGDCTGSGPESSDVMVAHAAANNQHPLLSQRLDCAANLDMSGGIKTYLQRKLDDRDISVWVD